MKGFLRSGKKEECFGCEGCVQACPKNAIKMVEDEEGFRYPAVNEELCVNCSLCNKVCSCENMPKAPSDDKLAFGGYHKDRDIKAGSTSGGAFSAIVEGWCDENYVIFGAASEGLRVYHDHITDKKDLFKFRKSKYSQSEMGNSFKKAKEFLKEGKKVLFSGTPCQIAGLRAYLGNDHPGDLLTVEVICEGVPSPHFVRSYDKHMIKKYGASITSLDYRFKDMKKTSGKWDFEVMETKLQNGKRIKQDRWFNPFWSIWLNHLMSRPSCYKCPFTTTDRVADISLGDLWGVHLYCPELYGKNGGASLVVCNSTKGALALEKALPFMFGHELDFNTALKYQSPMRKAIDTNEHREAFLKDAKVLPFDELCKRWAKKPTFKLLWQKYVWGNRQKIALYNFKKKFVK
ncbi:MAG: Coenzyme F420 hydrogenase/dehydrogenase, beta subunit C-terminal domain [Clostridia bacterium]|nr:Coenzyme F420 hydrogenase/dehydrogenase, beta subunit C-terminal domain [Clostridia bacterium]